MNELFSLEKEPMQVNCGYNEEGYHIWCGSVIFSDEDNKYHMFASRWSNKIPFHPGWLVASEVVRATSDTLEGPYKFAESVLPPRGAEYWDGRMTHNPRILKIGAKYVLFYTGSTYTFELPENGMELNKDHEAAMVARSNKRVGIATADSIFGPWERRDTPILDVKPNTYYSYLTSNPSPLVEKDGSIYLMFKSRKYIGNKYSEMYLGVAKAASYDSEFEIVTPEPLTMSEVEDPFVWRNKAGKYCMVAKDMTGNIAGVSSDGVFADSADGINWKAHGRAYNRTIFDTAGKQHDFCLVERPFLYEDNGKFTTMFAAVTMKHPYPNTKDIKSWNCCYKVRVTD